MDFSIGNLVSSVVGAVVKVANAIGSVFSNPAEAVNGAIADIANITADGKIDEDEEEELLEDILKLYVGASILNIKNEMSNIDDILNNTITNFNNTITVLNKSAVLITSAEAAKYLSLKDKLSNLWNDFFMPADLPGELNATKMLDNPVMKGIGDVGGKLGLVGTVLNPVVEYNNSLKPYKDDIDAAYEIDPQNAWKYNCEMHVAAGADAASFGYARGVINTAPSLYELGYGETKFTQGWINNVNYWVNSRNLINEMDNAFKDPVKGPIIKQFLR
ncbi:hypothetical protein [Clostridium saccharobutylicum]|uniref:Uncharacterized protein n=1 Tax=Clostridium saccharobutylicum TaxID=169679 RepID=A0A1S8N588_CLOSA|nr:hypothetical protein [Clostridium saccharobutylicum]OOM11686.1 hypothetical protein CLOSAC_21130 [Clostridium saccharobutylicum]